MANPKELEALKRLRDYHWHAFRWHLDDNRQYVSDINFAMSSVVHRAIGILMGDGLTLPKLPEKYDNIPYGEWPD